MTFAALSYVAAANVSDECRVPDETALTESISIRFESDVSLSAEPL